MTLLYLLLALILVGAVAWWGGRFRAAPGTLGEGPAESEGERPSTASSSADQLREPVTALLLGGLSLAILGQSVYAATQPNPPRALYWLLLVGLAAFLLAGQTIVRQNSGLWQRAWLARVARYLGVSVGQLVLLLLAPALAYLARLAAGDGLRAIDAPSANIAWLLAFVAVVAGSWRRGGALVDGQPVRFGRREGVITAVLFLAAFALRGTLLNEIPTTLSGDEASAGLSAVRFLTSEADNLFSIGWFSFPALFYAVQSAGIALWGQTAEGLRITAALAGAATVAGLYWLARSLFGRTTGLLAALYLLAAHYHIHFSRIGLQNIWDGLFLVITLAGLWTGWQRNWRAGFVLAGVALGLGQYFYVSMRIVPLLLLGWAGIALLADRARFRARLPDLLLTAYIAAVIFLPLGLFFADHPAEFNAPMQRVSVFNGWLVNEVQLTGEPAWQIILKQVRETALGFTHRPLRHWYNPGTPLLLAVPAALFMLGLAWAVYESELSHLLVLLPIVAIVLLGGFSQDAPASQRFVLAAPGAAILVALPLGRTAAWLSRLWPGQRRVVLTAVFVVMTGVAAGDLRYYFFEVYDTYVLGGTNTLAATEIAHYLRDHETPGQKVYFFGVPRMGYYSLSTIPYLAPTMRGEDVIEPLRAPPDWSLDGPTLFVFLPERAGELEQVQSAFPNGRYRLFTAPDQPGNPPLFISYEWRP